MKHEKYFQYTKGWYTINITNPFNHDSLVQWCNENGTDGRFHPVYYYYCRWGGDPAKLSLASYLVKIKFSLLDDVTEFLLMGDGIYND